MSTSGRWIAALTLSVCALAQAQGYGPPPTGYSPGPTYGQPVSYGQPVRERGRIEISGFAGYQLSSDAGTCCGTIVIDGSAVYGAALGYEVRPGYSVELMWTYVPTNVAFRSTGLTFPSSDGKSSLGLHYIQIGGLVGRRLGRVEPYGTVSAGLVIISPSALRLTDGSTFTPQSSVQFAFTAGLGAKIWINEMIAIRLETRALVPVYFTGTSFYVGTGGGGVGLSGGIPFAQFDFTGGLTIAL